jgi:uncharacterized protein (DUF58 family)
VRSLVSRAWSGLRDGVTPLGRAVLSTGVLALTIARITGLVELAVVAALCLLLVVIGLLTVMAPSNVRAHLVLKPDRTSAGVPVHGRLKLTNRWPLPVGRPVVEVPTGGTSRWERLPTLRPHASREADLLVPAARRGVVVVGPVVYRRTDPVGLFARRVRWAAAVELLVRPATVHLAGLPIGHLRDLEGVPSDRISMSDLAFHALREYVRGDDLRHVHWRSSARAGQLLVRQYHDSRRTSALLVVVSRPDSYADPDDFELALSVAASIALRAGHDGYDLSLVCGPTVVGAAEPTYVLDAFGRATLAEDDAAPPEQVRRGLVAAYDASMLFLVTGTAASAGEIQGVGALAPPDLWASIWRAGADEEPGLAELAGRPIVTVGSLEQVPVLMSELVR